MKKITQPQLSEEAVYYSDFAGHCFGEFYPAVEIKIQFNYGSKHDGEVIELHLTDEECEPFLQLIKKQCSQEFQDNIKFL